MGNNIAVDSCFIFCVNLSSWTNVKDLKNALNRDTSLCSVWQTTFGSTPILTWVRYKKSYWYSLRFVISNVCERSLFSQYFEIPRRYALSEWQIHDLMSLYRTHFNLKNSNCECVFKLKYTRNLFIINILSLFCKISKKYLLILHERALLSPSCHLWYGCRL